MKRRQFILALGGAAVAWPLAARAQREPVRRIGLLMAFPEGDAEAKARIAALLQTLEGLGWVEGRNVRLDYRWTSTDIERMAIAAKELVALRPDLLIGITTPGTAALARATSTIPIIFMQVSDPVGSGLISTLARPGGNVTGFTNFEFSMGGKWLEMLKEISPQINRVGVLFNPETAPYGKSYVDSINSAATTFGVSVVVLAVHDTAAVDGAVANFATAPDGALIVPADIFTTVNRDLIVTTAAKYRVPTVYPFRFFAANGGLISYGIENIDLYRRAAVYVDRILKGAMVSDLPVQQPTKFELVINLKTAKAMGLTVPPTLLSRADEVIE
jgi:putative ABC transport system substrate-binding protein